MAQKKVIIVGSGFGGLGAACILGKAGYDVTVLEKNEQIGGRASLFKAKGFSFDAGPSWYLMPDIFEHFFELMGENVNDYLDLKKLAPSYRIFYKDQDKHIDIYSDLKKDLKTIGKIEPSAPEALKEYLAIAGEQYKIAKEKFLYKNYDSIRDFLTWEVAKNGRKLNAFANMDSYVKKYFKTDEMYKIIQYPSVFLGSSPYKTPALYSMMNFIDFDMGVYYPMGGIHTIVKALEKIAKKYKVTFKTNTDVSKIIVKNGEAVGVVANGKTINADIVVSNASVWHTETKLLDKQHREKTEKYWKKRTLAPSALIMYLGVKDTYKTLQHHNLVFSKDWKKNFSQIFDNPKWPDDPSLYVCAPSKTDPGVAPKGHENLFVLVPIASGLNYTETQLQEYSDKILETMETTMQLPNLRKNLVYKQIFTIKDFASRYNSQGGTALGLAHVLSQTAVFRPSNINKKVKNFYYVGADVNPGIGMPITLISAELMYKRIIGDSTAQRLSKI